MRRKGNENFSSKKGMAYDGWEKKVIHFGGLKLFFFFSSVFHINQRGGRGGGGGGGCGKEMLFIPWNHLWSVYIKC